MKASTSPTYVPNKRKYLFVGDQAGMSILMPLMQKALKEDTPFEAVFTGDREETDLTSWLQSQKMGCYLYIAMNWDELTLMMKTAGACGFSEEEAQYIGHGVKEIRVFCCRCHHVTTVYEHLSRGKVRCRSCQVLLSVSDHYSPRRESYLGYITSGGAKE